jgi:hypothetical protein
MSRNVSATFKQAAFAQETDEAFLVLITLDHEDLTSPIRVVNNQVAITSNGNTFQPYAFKLTVPDDTERNLSQGRLSIDNISREIIEAIRSISSAPSVTIQVVLASDPDTVEIEYSDFELKNITYDAEVVSGNLVIETFVKEPFPGESFTPGNFPGLF